MVAGPREGAAEKPSRGGRNTRELSFQAPGVRCTAPSDVTTKHRFQEEILKDFKLQSLKPHTGPAACPRSRLCPEVHRPKVTTSAVLLRGPAARCLWQLKSSKVSGSAFLLPPCAGRHKRTSSVPP